MHDIKAPTLIPTASQSPSVNCDDIAEGAPINQPFQPDIEFVFVSDPGHGWLMVPEAWIFACCLEPASFSTYSYVSGDHIYALEEDCDAAVFANAFERRFNRPFRIKELMVEHTDIRQWQPLLMARAA